MASEQQFRERTMERFEAYRQNTGDEHTPPMTPDVFLNALLDTLELGILERQNISPGRSRDEGTGGTMPDEHADVTPRKESETSSTP